MILVTSMSSSTPQDSVVAAQPDLIVLLGDHEHLRAGDEVLVLTTPEAEDEVVATLLG